MEKYIVTCTSSEVLESLYVDMETTGGNGIIPDRAVECKKRLKSSKNTVYILTAEEAENLKQDERITNIVKESDILLHEPKPHGYTQFSQYWKKNSGQLSGEEKNWGLKRCIDGTQREEYWGYNGYETVSGKITNTMSGKNVDVVIVDGHLNSLHPEFAKHPLGIGGSRVKLLDWDVFTNYIDGTTSDLPTTNGTYIYGDGLGGFTEYGANHGMHVAGTAAGNTQGWARDANIYNISPYSSGGVGTVANPNSSDYRVYYENYLKAFHELKPINPKTGVKNPTVANGSFGTYYPAFRDNTTTINYQGAVVSTDPSQDSDAQLQLWKWGDYNENFVYSPYRPDLSDPSIIEIENMLAAGVIYVIAAGNTLDYFAADNDADWNNYFTSSTILNGATPINWYYCRGDFKALGGAISAGNLIAFYLQLKRSDSARGPGLDLFAPGDNIMSSIHAIGDSGAAGVIQDPRNSSFYLDMYGGTSMASPQIAGMIACLAELYPNMNNEQAKEYMIGTATTGQMTEFLVSQDLSDAWYLANSPDRIAYNKLIRQVTGNVSDKTHAFRPTSGPVYPRKKIKKFNPKNIKEWYPIFIGYANMGPDHFKITGEDFNGSFTNRDTSVTGVTIGLGDAISFANLWGSGAVSGAHPIRISSTVGGNEHADVINNSQASYTFFPQAAGTYYAFCTNHNTMQCEITVLPAPTYSVSSPTSTAAEGNSFTFTVTTTNVKDKTLLYYEAELTGTTAENTQTDPIRGVVEVVSNTATIIVEHPEDYLSEFFNQQFVLQVKTDWNDGPLVATSAVKTLSSSTTNLVTQVAAGDRELTLGEGSSDWLPRDWTEILNTESDEQGYTVECPFSFYVNGTQYNNFFVHPNQYILFGSTAAVYSFADNNPAVNKIFIGAYDTNYHRVASYTDPGDRFVRVRVEGNWTWQESTPNEFATVIYEFTVFNPNFTASNASTFEILLGNRLTRGTGSVVDGFNNTTFVGIYNATTRLAPTTAQTLSANTSYTIVGDSSGNNWTWTNNSHIVSQGGTTVY